SQTMLDLSKDTLDPRLAKRAFQMASAGRDMSEALDAAREWVLLAPDDPQAIATSLAVAASNGDTSGLSAALWDRIEKAQDKNVAIAQAAAIVSKMENKKLAFEVLDGALRDPVRSLPMAHIALADAAWAAGDSERALTEAQTAMKMAPDSEPAAQRVLEYGMKVNPSQAISVTKAFIAGHPDSRKLQLMLVNHLVGLHETAQALDILHEMRRRTPEDFDLLYTEAEVDFRAGDYEQAKALLGNYIDVQTQRGKSFNVNATNAQSDVSDARLLLVQIAEKQNKLADAIEQLRLIDDPTVRFQAHLHMAVLQARMGNIPVARKTLANLKPDSRHEKAVIALTLAAIYRNSGRTDDALQVLVDADKALPDTSEIKYDLGMMYARQGKLKQFEALMRRVIELDPDNADAYNSLGYTYADQNEHLDEARDLLDHALELDPGNPFILDSMGWYLYRVNDLHGALDYLERAYRKLPTADVAAHLGEVLWKLRRHEQARKVWQEGYKQDPHDDTLLKTLKRFRVTFK
ncbi:MAG TPA: tetratricopeptide repeat protein, partial [Burkholderiaceae bacterium]|nr:tetratricopeptide repeat protein [Burkholderiaceae bacterium]